MLGIPYYQNILQKRVGGGVTLYILNSIDSAVYRPPFDNNNSQFELLWIKLAINNSDCFLGALYHPPKPIYQVNDFCNFLDKSLDSVNSVSHNSMVILAGDFNQLPDSKLTDLGLSLSVHIPTHKGHHLDKIFLSQPIYSNIKAVKSSIKTDHLAIIARSDNQTIVDHSKTSLTHTSPTQACT